MKGKFFRFKQKYQSSTETIIFIPFIFLLFLFVTGTVLKINFFTLFKMKYIYPYKKLCTNTSETSTDRINVNFVKKFSPNFPEMYDVPNIFWSNAHIYPKIKRVKDASKIILLLNLDNLNCQHFI